MPEYCDVVKRICPYCILKKSKRKDGMEQQFFICEKTGKRIRRDTVCPKEKR